VIRRVLVAGIGNIFFHDDAFGVSVAQRLASMDLPAGVHVREVGIRGLHLAYDLLERWEELVVVDAVSTGAPPGTLTWLEPSHPRAGKVHDAHGMDLGSILDAARALGATIPRVVLVGCDVADVTDGIGLSPEVEAAVPHAISKVLSLVRALPDELRGVESRREVVP
jgi:hydrogenase maturation protease